MFFLDVLFLDVLFLDMCFLDVLCLDALFLDVLFWMCSFRMRSFWMCSFRMCSLWMCSLWMCCFWRKEKKRKDYAFRRQFNEKLSIIPPPAAHSCFWMCCVLLGNELSTRTLRLKTENSPCRKCHLRLDHALSCAQQLSCDITCMQSLMGCSSACRQQRNTQVGAHTGAEQPCTVLGFSLN